MADHPKSALERAVELLKWKRDAELSRCAKACFFGADGKTPTTEGATLLADICKQSRLFESAIRRRLTGEIDRDELLRIEARREVALRLFNLLELGPQEAARIVEVDNGQV